MMIEKKQRFHYSFLRVLTGSDLSRRRLPMMSVESGSEGPSVFLTACIHGDEVGGIVVVQELFKRLRKSPLKKGSILAFPLVNQMGFEAASRHVTAGKEDLNRSFPGNPNGSLAERIASMVWQHLEQARPDLVLDLHNDWRESIPYTLIDPCPKDAFGTTFEKIKGFATVAGFPVVMDTEPTKGSLSNTALLANIPALTLELGGAYVVDENNVRAGLSAIWKILSRLEMVDGDDAVGQRNLEILRYSHQPLSSSSGIIRFLAKPGQKVKKDQPVAKIYNAFGKLLETIHAAESGLVLGYSDSSVSFPGTPVMAFGFPGSSFTQ